MSNYQNEVMRIKDYLRSAILRAELAEGVPIHEDQLRAETGGSTRAIKQALIELAREGLIDRRRHQGTHVAPRRPVVVSSVLPFVRSLGVLCSYFEKKFEASLYAQALVRGVRQSLHAPSKLLVLCNSENQKPGLEDLPALDVDFVKRTLQGLIAVECHNAHDLNDLVRAGIPVVSLDYYPSDGMFDVVKLDHIEAGFAATAYLQDLNHHRIAFVGEAHCHPRSDPTWQDRLSGYQRAMTNRAGAEPRLLVLDMQRDIKRLSASLAEFHRTHLPTAYVLSSGNQAEVALRVFAEMGIACPSQISLACADNAHDTVRNLNLSRFLVEYEKLGQLAVKALASRLACRPMPPFCMSMSGRFAPGETTAPLAS